MAERKTTYRGGWRKWVLIYVAIGIVMYVIIYFAFIHHGGSGSGGGLYTVAPLPFLAAGRRALRSAVSMRAR